MRATLNLSDRHLERAKEVAQRSGRRPSDVVNEALALYLVDDGVEAEEPPFVIPVFDGGPGEQPLEPDDLKDLLMEEDTENLERINRDARVGASS